MKHGLGLGKILGTIHTYPTMAEANKFAAGAWKRGTVTRGQHTLLAAFHAWRRGAAGFGGVLGALPALVARPASGRAARRERLASNRDATGNMTQDGCRDCARYPRTI